MAVHQIDEGYLRDFFGIPEGPEGREELKDIKSRLIRQQFSHGEDICSIDGEPDGMFFLESGNAAVLDREGEQINIMHEGQYFGEYGVLSGERRLSTVRSMGRTVVYKMETQDVMAVLQRHPGVYGELMKRVYGQVSRKHTQLVALSRMQRGVLSDPGNQAPMTPLRMAIQYGILGLIFLISYLLIPADYTGPVFLLPLALMVVYAIFTRRTLESLVVGGMLASALIFRTGFSASYTDALMATMGNMDNVFTVLVMALMGAMVNLIESSGAVTAFKKVVDARVKSKKGALLSALGILAVTGIDDCLNMLCAATSLRTVAEKQRIPREDSALLLSIMPTPLCSFIPFSLWGIFVTGTVVASVGNSSGIAVFFASIPFNYFSIVCLIAMLLLALGRLPRNKDLRRAKSRVDEGGELWPEGSERYLIRDEVEVWGKVRNLLLPVIVLAVGCVAVRSIFSGSLVMDSAVGLVFALLFTFFLYCGQGIMSPEKFFENMVSGIQSMTLPIMLYLLTMCFSALLEHEAMGEFFNGAVQLLGPVSFLVPAVLFLVSTLVTVSLGSSWAMYVIGIPVALHMAANMGLSVPLCVGAVASAGIAGEKNCAFTSDALSVANAIGCDPDVILKVRLKYSVIFSAVALLMYVAAGLIF